MCNVLVNSAFYIRTYFDLYFKTYAWIDWWLNSVQYAYAMHLIDEIDCSIDVKGYGFDDYDYPDMTVDRITDYYFEINTNGSEPRRSHMWGPVVIKFSNVKTATPIREPAMSQE